MICISLAFFIASAREHFTFAFIHFIVKIHKTGIDYVLVLGEAVRHLSLLDEYAYHVLFLLGVHQHEVFRKALQMREKQ